MFKNSYIIFIIKYSQTGSKAELTYVSTLCNVTFCIFNYLDIPILSSPANNFPFSILFRADEHPEFTKLERMGGTLTHLLSEYDKQRLTTFEAMKGDPSKSFYFALFNQAILLFNYSVVNAFFIAVKGFDKFV